MKNKVKIIHTTDDDDFDGYVLATQHDWEEHGQCYVETWDLTLAKKLLPIVQKFYND